jgi:hypothetical protein
LNFLAALSSVLNTILNRKKINELVVKLESLDYWLKNDLKIHLNAEKANSSFTVQFIVILSTTVLALCSLTFNSQFYGIQSFTRVSLSCLIILIVYVQLLQIAMISHAFLVRLKVLSLFKTRKSTENMLKAKEAILKLHDLNEKFIECFRISFWFSISSIYLSVLTELYFFGSLSLGYPLTVLLDAVLYFIPCSLVLLLMGQIDRETQKYFKKICLTLTCSRKSLELTEDLMMLHNHFRFSARCFGMIDTSFEMLGKVSEASSCGIFLEMVLVSSGHHEKSRVRCYPGSVSTY